MVNLHTGIEDDVIAQGHAVADIDLRVNLHVLTDGHAVTDVGKCTDIHIIGQGSALANVDGLLDAAFLGTLAVDEVQQVGERLVRVIDADERGFYLLLGLEVLAHQHSRSLGRIDEVGVFGIGEKSEATGGGLLYFGIIVNDGCGIAVNRTVNHCCKLLCSNFH